MGDPARHLAFDAMCRALDALPPAPETIGRLVLVVRRAEEGRRETLDNVHLTPELGVPGDGWGRKPGALPEAQISVIQIDVATLIANGQPLTLFGDNLFVELDLSARSLPIGSRVRIGAALLEVSPKPHNGCKKFKARFGMDALRVVSATELRPRNLRGIYMRVIQAGDVCSGDSIAREGPPDGRHTGSTVTG